MDKLLKLLGTSASIQPDKLAGMLGVTPAEVKKKIQQYEEEKLILGYKAVINDEVAAPQAVKAAIEIGVRPERSGGFNRTAARIAATTRPTPAIRAAAGTATRWWSTSPASTVKTGSIRPATSSLNRNTWSSASP